MRRRPAVDLILLLLCLFAAPQDALSGTLGDLPLVEVPAAEPRGDVLAVFYSGDGGWARLDRGVSQALTAHGTPAVGVDSRRYFSTRRDPDGSARDLDRILRHYLAAWKRERVLLIGYSFGADVMPFLASRLPPDLAGRIELVALIGASHSASFELHLTDWLFGSRDGRPVLPEVRKLAGRRLLCIYGKEEDDTLCPDLGPGLGRRVPLAGGHHFAGAYETIGALLLREAGLEETGR
ncbi:MAG TPA: AcvB/VirJ family lysyl-phosphatidylglycerol hydrolase [Thermoanaerobaculia bacterium]|nr:AcvB/VirJ family lysyl-phosphatidylglycerol hydrolase [Thermoanaerobaculia bacterium]